MGIELNRFQVHDSSGVPIGAVFDLELADGHFSLIFHSGGGSTAGGGPPRNIDYNRGLKLVLERLGGMYATLVDAFVDSSYQKH